MTSPKNMRTMAFNLENGGTVHAYSNVNSTILQIRKSTPTEEDILQPSFKVAVSLTPSEALAIASELVLAASHRLKTSNKIPVIKASNEEAV